MSCCWGGEGQSVLIEELQDAQLIWPPLSAGCPGPGRALLTLIRSPFAFNKDVVCLLGPDDAGLRAGIGELSRLAKEQSPVSSSVNSEPRTPSPAWQTLPGELKPGTPFATMDGAPSEVVSTSTDGKTIAFATGGYAKSLFVFDDAGNPKFEDKVGHVNTQAVQVLPRRPRHLRHLRWLDLSARALRQDLLALAQRPARGPRPGGIWS